MSRMLRMVASLCVTLASPCPSARAGPPEDPDALRQAAQAHLLRGEFSRANGGLGGVAPPLDQWRGQLSWEETITPQDSVRLVPPQASVWGPCASDGPPPAEGWAAWPVLAAMLRERCQRETVGAGTLPKDSPLASLPDPDGTIARFFAVQQRVYHPVPAEQSPDPTLAAEARVARELADSLRSTSRLWAILSAGLLLVLALGLGLRLRPVRPGT